MTDLAAEQLADLADTSAGAIQVLGSRPLPDGTLFTISLDTAGVQTAPGGIKVRGRERFEVVIGPSFPFQPPIVKVTHRRWARCSHVQWGRQLCLYAAPPVEWNPVDGMRGLVSRLCLWLERAAAGDLDPAEQPLHPPVAYASYDHGWMVVRPDLGDRVPWRRTDGSEQPEGETRVGTLFAWCTRVGARVDVLEWLSLTELVDRVLAPPAATPGDTIAETAFVESAFVAPLVQISETLDMEHPSRAATRRCPQPAAMSTGASERLRWP